jgi:hypothetical protein
MRIGVMADSHGEVLRTRRAIELLRNECCDRLIHLGDFETCEVLDELIDLPVDIVLGNCDSPSLIGGHAARVGINNHHPAGLLDIDGSLIAFLHGDDQRQFDSFVADGVPWLLHGHTHCRSNEIVDRTRVVNPGALHRAAIYTVAVIDVAAGSVQFLDVA